MLGYGGDGQMLPRQTKRTETGLGVASVILGGLCGVEGVCTRFAVVGCRSWQIHIN
jgi:hypothetical protein